MRFFWVILLFGSQVLSAASVAVITQDNAQFSTSCSAGTVNLTPCPPGIPGATGGISGPNYQVTADAGPDSSGVDIPIPGAAMVSEQTDADAVYLCGGVPCPSLIPLDASASASAVISGYTEGPSRLGSVEVSLNVVAEVSCFPYLEITDGTNTYDSFGENSGCCAYLYEGTLDFKLGGPFSVSIRSASSQFSCLVGSSYECYGGADTSAAIEFVFLEPDGSPIPFGSQVTPEPNPWALCALGLAFVFPRFRRFRM